MANKAGKSTTIKAAPASTSTSTPGEKDRIEDASILPFTRAPSQLTSFLSTLDQSKVYITHVDTHLVAFKKRIFTVPVLLNLSIASLLAWRVYSIYPSYVAIILYVLGQPSAAAIDTASTPWSKILALIGRRCLMLALDYFLFAIVAQWPYSFFFETPGNPCIWRWKVGFRDREIVVRKSRGWGRDELLKGEKQMEQSPFWKVRLLPALDRHWMQSRTGYMMMGKDWDLDFRGMVDATVATTKETSSEGTRKGGYTKIGTETGTETRAETSPGTDTGAEEGEEEGQEEKDSTAIVTIEDFKKTVLLWIDEAFGWAVWQVWKEEEQGQDEEARNRIVAFKDRLTLMGKESLFFRWIEIVQYESSQAAGGFTVERQNEAVRKAREVFEAQNIDFDDFVDTIGGIKQFPGLEESRL